MAAMIVVLFGVRARGAPRLIERASRADPGSPDGWRWVTRPESVDPGGSRLRTLAVVATGRNQITVKANYR